MGDRHIYSERFASILDNLICGVLLISEDGVVLEHNKLSSSLLGVESDKIDNVLFSSLFPKEFKECLDNYFGACLGGTSNDSGKFEIESVKEEARCVFQIDCNQHYFSEEDQNMYIICILSDITEQKKLEEELALQRKSKQYVIEKLEKEQELSDLKTKFITVVSHEFRTPLAGILSSVDLMERYLKTDKDLWDDFVHKNKLERHIGKVKTSIDTLTSTLNQLLSISRVNEEEIEYDEETFDLKSTIRGFVNELEHVLKPGQKIIFNFLSEDKRVGLNKISLRNVITSLLSNAIKYSSENQNIYLTASVLSEIIEIEVRDEGIGIPEHDQRHIFKRFFRASNVTNIKGTGLGLNIVSNHVNLLKGQITFESEEGKGTTFKVVLNKRK